MHLLAIFIRGTWWLGIILTAVLVILTRLLYSLSPNKRKWIGIGILSAIGIFLIVVSMYYMPFRQGEKHPVAAMLVYAGTTMEYNAQGNLGYHNFTCLLLDAQTEDNDPFADGQFQFEFKESLDSPNGTFDNKKAFFYYRQAMLRYEHPECDPAVQLGLSVPTKEPELPPCIIHGKEAHIGDICCVVVRNYKRLGTGETFRRIYDVYVPDSAVAYNRELLLERCNQFLGQ